MLFTEPAEQELFSRFPRERHLQDPDKAALLRMRLSLQYPYPDGAEFFPEPTPTKGEPLDADSIADIVGVMSNLQLQRTKFFRTDKTLQPTIDPLKRFIEKSMRQEAEQERIEWDTDLRAQALLVGVFRWQDVYIARMEGGKDKGWHYVTEFDVTKPIELWDYDLKAPFRYHADAGAWVARRGAQHVQWIDSYEYRHRIMSPPPGYAAEGYFNYFAGLKPRRLIDRGLPSDKRGVPLDRNPYNCHPDNIGLASKRGRRSLCARCGRECVKANSRLVDGLGGGRYRRRYRYCLDCLRAARGGRSQRATP